MEKQCVRTTRYHATEIAKIFRHTDVEIIVCHKKFLAMENARNLEFLVQILVNVSTNKTHSMTAMKIAQMVLMNE
jgi:hypothetical protein